MCWWPQSRTESYYPDLRQAREDRRKNGVGELGPTKARFNVGTRVSPKEKIINRRLGGIAEQSGGGKENRQGDLIRSQTGFSSAAAQEEEVVRRKRRGKGEKDKGAKNRRSRRREAPLVSQKKIRGGEERGGTKPFHLSRSDS